MSSCKVEESVKTVCKYQSVLSNLPFINEVSGVSPSVQLNPLHELHRWTFSSCFNVPYLLYLLVSCHRLNMIDKDQASAGLWLFLWPPSLPPNVWRVLSEFELFYLAFCEGNFTTPQEISGDTQECHKSKNISHCSCAQQAVPVQQTF